jgi:RNA polymerase sigma factor (sigma-70 family)
MSPPPTVFVVDDDLAIRQSLHWLIASAGWPVETYASAQEFLDSYQAGRPGCLVLDVRMAGLSGLELQDRLAAQEVCLPIIIITGHGDVPMAVRALKAGALDFLEKPFPDQVLLDRIRQALEQDARARDAWARQQELRARLARLTPREREVMDLVVAGKPNKVIAAQLGVSDKTVEAHRAKLMEKMQADNVADLVRLVLTLTGLADEKPR